jgi:small conductance mechanosensitive channel
MVNWPQLITAVGLALLVAYLIADLVARVVERALRAFLPDDHERALVNRPGRIVRLVTFLIVTAAVIFPALRIVGYDMDIGSSPREAMRWLISDGRGLHICSIILTAYAAIRLGAAAAYRFEREMSVGTGLDVVERTKRAHTLSTMLQKTLTVTVIGIAALMVLHEIGVDTTPVLTSAGILGLAVGFGAQSLVRDVISGFFLILEDQVRVGDVATVNGQGGLVEAVNLRTIVVRDEEGTVHVFPNGEIKTLANRSKDFAYYVISVVVADTTDPDDVVRAMQDAAATLLDDPAFKPHILAPLEVQGVDDVRSGQITVKARIKTVPLKQWLVGREMRKRINATFKARRIDSPVPQMHVTVDNLGALLDSARRD